MNTITKRKVSAAACAGMLVVVGIPIYATAGGDPQRGKDLFENKCAVCHNSNSTDIKIGPGLKGVFKRTKLVSTGKPVTWANVLDAINKGGNTMPPFADVLKPSEKADLITYLKTL